MKVPTCNSCRDELPNDSFTDKEGFLYCSLECYNQLQDLKTMQDNVLDFLKFPKEYLTLFGSSNLARKQLKSKFFREKVFEVRGKNCEHCGTDKDITLHHFSYDLKIPNEYIDIRNESIWPAMFKKYPNEFQQNIDMIRVLCNRCHYKEHLRLKKETGFFMPIEEINWEKPKKLLERENKKYINTDKRKFSIADIKNKRHTSTTTEELLERYPNHGKNWTQEEGQKVETMYKDKHSLEDIAKKLGRSPVSISFKLCQLGLATYDKETQKIRSSL